MKVLYSIYTYLSLAMAAVFFAPSAHAQTADALDAKLQEVAEKYELKGISATVRFADGSAWSGAQGAHGNDGDLNADMLFEMGSITKSMTASIILQLVEEDALSLEDSLHQFFAPLKNIDSNITVKQLLNHTSGIYTYEDNPSLAATVIIYPDRVWEPTDILDYIEPMYFEAGAGWAYSNTNYLLLGLIIEKIEGRSYHESLRKRLLEPFGLQHSYLDPNESYSEARALSWLSSGAYQDNVFEAILSVAWSAGALVSTSKDVALWAEKLYSGEVLGTAVTEAMLQTTQAGDNSYNYGFGTSLSVYAGRRVVGHNGNTAMQHANMSYCPELGLTLALAINQEDADAVLEQVKTDLLTYLFDQPWGLSVENHSVSPMTVVPNPATHQLQVYAGSSYGQLQLLNGTGQVVWSQAVSGTAHLDVSHLPKGAYLVRWYSEKGTAVNCRKLLIH